MKIDQYSVYWTNLDPTQGAEINKTRPCVVVSPEEMNEFLKKSYKNTRELIFSPPTFEEEMKSRLSLIKHPFDMSPIFVVDEPIFDAKYKIELKFAISYSAMEQTP